MQLLLAPILIIGLIVIFAFLLYNSLVTMRNRIDEAWSDIDVQLKRRNSLIPNLIESVKGYMTHERSLLENITKLRSQIEQVKDPKQLANLDKQMSGALSTLKVQVENYPQLKANENFMHLQEELTNTEDKIAYSRRFYNSTVLEYNTAIQKVPAVLIAGTLGFNKREFFEAEEEERKDIKVDFSDAKK